MINKRFFYQRKIKGDKKASMEHKTGKFWKFYCCYDGGTLNATNKNCAIRKKNNILISKFDH